MATNSTSPTPKPKRTSRTEPTADQPPQKANPRRKLGNAGEAMALATLEAAGLKIIVQNWRCAAGELDIVAEEIAPDYASGLQEATWLVIVEVRTRRGDRFGTARQSLTPRKQAKLREVAGHYLQERAWRGPWRIDLVAIQMDATGRIEEIEHLRHAVTG